MRARSVLAVLAVAVGVHLMASERVANYRITLTGEHAEPTIERIAHVCACAPAASTASPPVVTVQGTAGQARTLSLLPGVGTVEELLPPATEAPAAVAANAVSGGVSATAGSTWETGAYLYDGAGNIRSIDTQDFTYDTLGRVTSAEVLAGGGTRTQAYTYDRWGNLSTIVTDGNTAATRTLAPSATTNGVTSGGNVGAVSYDAAGRLTSAGGWTYAWDAVDVLRARSSGTAGTPGAQRVVHLYSASEERIATIVYDASSGYREVSSEWTIRDTSGKVLRRLQRGSTPTSWSWAEDDIYADGRLLAAEVSGPARTLHFHLDHLGSPRLITNGSGAKVALHAYFPFGEEATDPVQEGVRLKFTGHERDSDTLDYMHARYANPAWGRFLSVDPHLDIKKNLPEPQRWNRYAYVTNNPLRYTDPTGREREMPRCVKRPSECTQAELSGRAPAGKQVIVTAMVAGGALVGAPLLQGLRTAASLAWNAILGNPLKVAQAGVAAAEMLNPGASPLSLEAKTGQKLGQQIGRWRAATGASGGRTEFLDYASGLANRAEHAGTSATGTVGSGPQALENATIYREGDTFLVVQDNKIMSYVPDAGPGGIRDEYTRLGGQ